MRLALAEDMAIFRESMARALTDLGFDVVISVSTGDDLLVAVQDTAIDIAILDVAMPPTLSNEGIVTAAALRARFPEVGILLLSAHAATPQAIELLREVSTGVGYLQKEAVTDLHELGNAIERVHAGELVVDRSLVRRLVTAPSRNEQLGQLSHQEREVLRLMAEGYTNTGIAAALHVSQRTIEDHVGRVFAKLEIKPVQDSTVNRRVLAVLTWLRLTGRMRD